MLRVRATQLLTTFEQGRRWSGATRRTIANHTFTHAGPDRVDVSELDRCSDEIEARLGRRLDVDWTW